MPEEENLPKEEIFNWFPGHMKKTLGQIREIIKKIDLIIEVRDARIPLTCANSSLENIFQKKKKIILLHKADTADPEISRKWAKHFHETGTRVLLTYKSDSKAIRNIFKQLREMRFERDQKFIEKGIRPPPVKVLVAGMPNTGKSTLINLLLGKKRTAIGDKPGVTKRLNWIAIRNDFEILDTPGVFTPKPADYTAGLKLAAVHCIRDERLDFIKLVRFLVDFLIRQKAPAFLPLKDPFENHDEVEFWKKMGKMTARVKKDGEPDIDQICRKIVKDFREGKFGRYSLEEVS